MAGILATFYKNRKYILAESIVEEISKELKHRGQYNTLKIERYPFLLVFHQNKNEKNNISINENSNSIIAMDGQIFNLKALKLQYQNQDKRKIENGNDLEIFIDANNKVRFPIFKELIGNFSGIIYNGIDLIGFKDIIGNKPLYYCETDNIFAFASEIKALTFINENIFSVPPNYLVSSTGVNKKYYEYPGYRRNSKITEEQINYFCEELNNLIKIAVRDNVKAGEKISSLLSGGLDSSIITYIAKDFIKDLPVYTIGVKHSKDIYYAKELARFYNLNHTTIEITLEDMLKILPDVIYALESFDAALIRSSVPMFIATKYIKEKHDSDTLLTGEGGDELFGGYEYLKNSISNEFLNKQLFELLNIEHKTGLQRVDRIPYFFSIEGRAPLFDKRIIEFSLKIPAYLKIFHNNGDKIEKWILRKAFEKELPPQIIWRKKQKFSDGAGCQFMMKDYFNSIISDEEFNTERYINQFITLRSKEELYYWRIFKSKFNLSYESISDLGFTKNYEI
jgi:asparagine synthase (glutamine-hydrolysing)